MLETCMLLAGVRVHEHVWPQYKPFEWEWWLIQKSVHGCSNRKVSNVWMKLNFHCITFSLYPYSRQPCRPVVNCFPPKCSEWMISSLSSNSTSFRYFSRARQKVLRKKIFFRLLIFLPIKAITRERSTLAWDTYHKHSPSFYVKL